MTFASARDGYLLFGTRFVRMFAYGFLSVALVLYLKAVGLAEDQIGLLLMLTLLGDVVVSLWITTSADRVGRRRMLAVGAARQLAAAEVAPGGPAVPKSRWGLHRSRGVVLRLSALFALDSFGGGFVIQSAVAYWFHIRFGVPPAKLGGIFFGANVLAGFSAFVAVA